MANTAWTAERLRKEQPDIKSENLKERRKVIDKLESMGFKLRGSASDEERFICICEQNHFITDSVNSGYCDIITASEFLTPPNPELTELKKRLLEIADSGVEEYESRYFNAMIDFIYDSSGTTCTALANLIINSDI